MKAGNWNPNALGTIAPSSLKGLYVGAVGGGEEDEGL